MKFTETRMLSKVSNRHSMYVKLDQLPTNFRSYPDNTNIYVRRLNMEETFNITQLDESNANKLLESVARIYEDVVISDNPNFTLYDLELVDFQLAIAVSSIWSSKKSGWRLDIHCPNAFCNSEIVKDITLDNFNFPDNVVKLPIPITLDGEEFNVRMLSVSDMIKLGKILESNPDLKQGILEYALMLEPKNPDSFKDILDIYNFLRTVPDEDYQDLVQIDNDATIVNYPLEISCPSCGSVVKVDKQLKDLKAYL